MFSTKKPRRSRRDWLIACVVLAALATVVLGGAAQPAAADSPQTAVLDWNKHALDALANAPTAGTPGAGQPPPVLSQHLAMVQGAVYDAVNSIDGGHEPYLDGLPSAPASASKAAAAATAARDTIIAILNQTPLTATFTAGVRQAIIDRINGPLPNGLYASSIAAATAADGASAVAAGVASGQAAAAAMIAERTGDGRYPASPFMFTVGTQPGEWRPTAGVNDPFAWVAKVEPFVVDSNEQFLSKGPRELKSGAYANEYNEVKELGRAGTDLTDEQQGIFDFFQANPVEMYSRSFRTYALAEGLDLAEQARLFAKFSLSGADTFITCWEDKGHWSFWRPMTAIQLGDTDGNAKTDGDPNWISAVANPPYPDHSSGYNCTTGSYMEVAEMYFGQGRTTFTVAHPTGATRTYDHFRDVWNDTIDARVFQGIHFRSADEQGVGIGRDVARWVDKHALQSVK
jgi:hypothetical protein